MSIHQLLRSRQNPTKFELSSIKSITGIQADLLRQQITLLEIVVP